MKDNRDQTIGTRFTSRERKFIEAFMKDRYISLSEFVREAIFSHINNLVSKNKCINLQIFSENFKFITNAAKMINKSVIKLKKELK